jgi:hypothetical protein
VPGSCAKAPHTVQPQPQHPQFSCNAATLPSCLLAAAPAAVQLLKATAALAVVPQLLRMQAAFRVASFQPSCSIARQKNQVHTQHKCMEMLFKASSNHTHHQDTKQPICAFTPWRIHMYRPAAAMLHAAGQHNSRCTCLCASPLHSSQLSMQSSTSSYKYYVCQSADFAQQSDLVLNAGRSRTCCVYVSLLAVPRHHIT